MLEVSAAKELRGKVTLPPSSDLFFLTCIAALAGRVTLHVSPAIDTPESDTWRGLFEGRLSFERSDSGRRITPSDETGIVPLGDCRIPWREFAAFVCLGVGHTLQCAESCRVRVEWWKSLAESAGCSLAIAEDNSNIRMHLERAEEFRVPEDPLDGDMLYVFLGLAMGLRRSVKLILDTPFSSPLRPLLRDLGYEYSVRDLSVEKRDPMARRIRRMKGKKGAEEPPRYELHIDFEKGPAESAEISLPGDETLCSVLIAAKSLIPRGGLVVQGAPLEQWAMPALELARRMGCKPGVQETGQSSFGAMGMIQLQTLDLTGRKTLCRPACHYARHIPAMCTMAMFASGQSVFRGLEDLRRNSPDGVEELISCAARIGARHGGMPDGLVIEGSLQYDGFDLDVDRGAHVNGALAIAGLRCMGTTSVNDDSIRKRWPGFDETISSICEYRR